MKKSGSTQLCVGLFALCAMVAQSRANESYGFRLLQPGPNEPILLSTRHDGWVTWSHALGMGTVLVQRASGGLFGSGWQDYVSHPITNASMAVRLFDPRAPAGMAFVPTGSFEMGDALGDGAPAESPVRAIFVDGFYMDRTEISKSMWDEVSVWAGTNGYDFGSAVSGKAPDHPVHGVSWYDAVKWCNARSEKEGRTPAYYRSGTFTSANVYRSGVLDVRNEWVQWNAGYRLPTEAEWEKAARAGARGHRFPWADSMIIDHLRANYYASTLSSYDQAASLEWHPDFNDGVPPFTSPVGSFASNAYGIYDTAGNVREWCWDWFGATYYASSPTVNPRGPATGSARVARGGHWNFFATGCRVSARAGSAPSEADIFKGFRVVLPVLP